MLRKDKCRIEAAGLRKGASGASLIEESTLRVFIEGPVETQSFADELEADADATKELDAVRITPKI